MEKWELEQKDLFTPYNLEDIKFESTDELDDMTDSLGQERAYEAMEFGFNIKQKGFNLFAMGPSGSGKFGAIKEFLNKKADNEEVAFEWCYVNNFEKSHQPLYLKFPQGRAKEFKKDNEKTLEDLKGAIFSAFDSEKYQQKRQEIESELKNKQQKELSELREKAMKEGISLMETPAGIAFTPIKDGKELSSEEINKLPEDERKELEEKVRKFQNEFGKSIQQQPKWQREAQNKIKELSREVVRNTVVSLLDELKRKYEDLPEVINHLDAVRDDIIDHAEQFQKTREKEQKPKIMPGIQQPDQTEAIFHRYKVNVLVDHTTAKGAPVIYEDDPAFQNLVGRIEHVAQMGALTTDFTRIKPGALHRANGGYLILDAVKVLTQPHAWEGLKRCLKAGEIQTESLGQALNLMSTVSLEPDPIPLNIKIVLIGERMIYYLLYQLDNEFLDFFKVLADFEENIDRNSESTSLYARWVATLVRRDELKPFDKKAVGRVIEQASRISGDAEKISIQLRNLTDLLQEADYWAGKEGRNVVSAMDVQHAIDARIFRTDRIRSRFREEVEKGRLLIDTEGEQIGQVNGLSILNAGELIFGNPSRITARVRVGQSKVIDIEREAKLGGSIHSKGLLIMSGFITGRYLPQQPLSMLASLVFEQSYSEVEGDSASSAELYALLSALAEVPIRQQIAVTGSVNQNGQVQAVGGVNQKIEGFFEVCKQGGLTGQQGVLIPAANKAQLMLRHDVLEATKEGKFHIYAVSHVDEGIEVLTGMPAGERNENGEYPEGTINHKVEERLKSFVGAAKEFRG